MKVEGSINNPEITNIHIYIFIILNVWWMKYLMFAIIIMYIIQCKP